MLLIKLWRSFFKFSLKRIRLLKNPLCVYDGELIGREIFSSRAKKGGKPRMLAFLPADLKDGISVNRLGGAPIALLHELGRTHATNRKPLRYYGMATVPAKRVRERYKDVKSDITLHNPFHANIWLPTDTDKDYAMLCAHYIYECAEAGFIDNAD